MDLNSIISWLALAGITALIGKIFTDEKGTKEKALPIVTGFLIFTACLVLTAFPEYIFWIIFLLEIITFIWLVCSFYSIVFPKFILGSSNKKNILLLKSQLNEIQSLRQLKMDNKEFDYWHNKTEVVISKCFGKDSEEVKKFSNIHFSPSVFFVGQSDSSFQQAYLNGLDSAESLLKALIDSFQM